MKIPFVLLLLLVAIPAFAFSVFHVSHQKIIPIHRVTWHSGGVVYTTNTNANSVVRWDMGGLTFANRN